MSVASSRQSSRSSTSRWGRDGDGNIVKKKQRRNARRDFLLQRLSLTKEADLQAKNKKYVTLLYQSLIRTDYYSSPLESKSLSQIGVDFSKLWVRDRDRDRFFKILGQLWLIFQDCRSRTDKYIDNL